MTRAEATARVIEAARLIVEDAKADLADGTASTSEKQIATALVIYDSTPDSEGGWPKAGYYVGEGKVQEGDTALFEGRECKVLTVYHDGDVQIEVKTYPTVKWRFVTPLPTPPAQEPTT